MLSIVALLQQLRCGFPGNHKHYEETTFWIASTFDSPLAGELLDMHIADKLLFGPVVQ